MNAYIRDLLEIQRLVQRIWSERCHLHIGDIAWRLSGRDWPKMVWKDNEAVVACAWVEPSGGMDLLVDPEFPSFAEVALEWIAIMTPPGVRSSVILLETETYVIRALEERGYERDNEVSFFEYLIRDLGHLPVPDVPSGFTIRSVSSADTERRAKAHREAWSLLPFADGDIPVKSRMTTASYRALMETWPYLNELDRVVVARNGKFVASCCGWLDERNRIVEMEPVSTIPGYRGLGLGKAVCLSVLQAARNLGAEKAIVYARGDDEYPAPKKLYSRMGFAPYARTCTYIRP